MENKKIKILVVDDDDVDRLHLSRAMTKSGFEFELVETVSGKTALEAVKAATFDCIFLDYLLPGNNGLELLQAIRKIGIRTPIVIITSQGSETIAVDLMKAGASDYVSKNQISGESLRKIILNALLIWQIETERESAVNALKLSESRLAEAQHIAKVGNFELNSNGDLYWSDEIYNILEIDKNEKSSVEAYFQRVHPDDLKDVMAELERTKKGKYLTSDHRIICPQGTIKHVHAQGESRFDQSGKLLKILGTVQDITNRKITEQEIVKARELAENSLKVREVFLANMSHEIRTPMNAIIGFTQLLYETALTDEQRGFVDAIHFSGENLLVVINDILDLSKIKSGKMQLEKIEFNLNQMVKGVVNTFRRRCQEKGLRLTHELASDVPNHIKGDPVRLNQILTNLISNAVKFTQEGYVHLGISIVSEEDDRFVIEFRVSDTGIGIEEESQGKIFESFVQASQDTTRKSGGTGLGLTIVKSIVELHAGEILLESAYGTGSTFTVRIPYEKADQEKVQIRNQEVTPGEPLHLLKRATILVVEDNHVNQILVKRVLEKVGCTTDVAENGLKAIERVKTGKYDLVLMDIQMPEMDGYSATKHIRTALTAPNCHIPIIAMTAHALSSEVEKCISIGMNDYISKPFKQEVLYSKIVKQLKRNTQVGIIPLHAEVTESRERINEIGLDSLYALLNDNRHLAMDLAIMYEKQAPVFALQLREALAENNFANLALICSQVKSSYSIIGIPELTETITRVERFLKMEDKQNRYRLHNAVEEVIAIITVITDEIKKSIRKTG